MTANALFLLATQQEGQLAITGVLASLYPVSTVVLAQAVLRERLVPAQVAGLGCGRRRRRPHHAARRDPDVWGGCGPGSALLT